MAIGGKWLNELWEIWRNCEDFLNWCLNIIKHYKSKIEQVDAIGAIEKEDKHILLVQAEVMEKLSFMVCDIQKDIWKIINKLYYDNTSQLDKS